jgi:hypothetical protein
MQQRMYDNATTLNKLLDSNESCCAATCKGWPLVLDIAGAQRRLPDGNRDVQGAARDVPTEEV